MNRKTVIAAAATIGILTTGSAASAATLPRPVYIVTVVSDLNGQLLKTDLATSLTAAQADQQREQAIFARYCTVIPEYCATVTIHH